MKSKYYLIDSDTKQPIITFPLYFRYMTEAALYAVQHDLRASIRVAGPEDKPFGEFTWKRQPKSHLN